ncbi:hypothetical protein KA005_22765, partial [bacterium]|nr:hypothetical protein [bacterium]
MKHARHGSLGIVLRIGVLTTLFLVSLAGAQSVDGFSKNRAEMMQQVAKLNIPFITNQGQIDERVKYYAKIFGGTVFITKNGEIFYSLPKAEEKKTVKGLSLKEELVGGKVHEARGERRASTRVSYFRGNDPSKWKSDIPTYDIVSLGEVYKGIELK